MYAGGNVFEIKIKKHFLPQSATVRNVLQN